MHSEPDWDNGRDDMLLTSDLRWTGGRPVVINLSVLTSFRLSIGP